MAEHPTWFRHRPDGSIRYAENPPKRYEDIYPFDFESADWQALWAALRDVVSFWVEQGVTVFRVDNPHTKPFAFWEWLIASIRSEHSRSHLPLRGLHEAASWNTWPGSDSRSRTPTSPGAPSKWEIETYSTELTRTGQADVPPAEPVAQHARHPERGTPDGRAGGLHRSPGPRRHSLVELRDLWAGFRAAGTPPSARGFRGIPAVREVRDPLVGPREPVQPLGVHRTGQPHPTRARGAAVQRPAAFPPHRQRAAHRLFESPAGPTGTTSS